MQVFTIWLRKEESFRARGRKEGERAQMDVCRDSQRWAIFTDTFRREIFGNFSLPSCLMEKPRRRKMWGGNFFKGLFSDEFPGFIEFPITNWFLYSMTTSFPHIEASQYFSLSLKAGKHLFKSALYRSWRSDSADTFAIHSLICGPIDLHVDDGDSINFPTANGNKEYLSSGATTTADVGYTRRSTSAKRMRQKMKVSVRLKRSILLDSEKCVGEEWATDRICPINSRSHWRWDLKENIFFF